MPSTVDCLINCLLNPCLAEEEVFDRSVLVFNFLSNAKVSDRVVPRSLVSYIPDSGPFVQSESRTLVMHKLLFLYSPSIRLLNLNSSTKDIFGVLSRMKKFGTSFKLPIPIKNKCNVIALKG